MSGSGVQDLGALLFTYARHKSGKSADAPDFGQCRHHSNPAGLSAPLGLAFFEGQCDEEHELSTEGHSSQAAR